MSTQYNNGSDMVKCVLNERCQNDAWEILKEKWVTNPTNIQPNKAIDQVEEASYHHV